MPAVTESKKAQAKAIWVNNEWAQRLARFGYASKGMVFITIGVLAIQAALGNGGKTTDQEGALQAIAQRSFGQILLGTLCFGLACYALWNVGRAILNLDDVDADAKGVIKRLWYATIGVSYGLLAWSAIQIMLNQYRESNNTQDWTATVLQWPLGRFAIMAVGLGFIGATAFEWYKAYSTDFTKNLDLHGVNPAAHSSVIWIGRIGLVARGVVFGLFGYFLIQAGLQHDAQQARDLGRSLETLAQQSYGPWLLLLLAIGVTLYGMYTLVKARYRRLDSAV